MFSISEGEGETPSSNPPVMLKGDSVLVLSLSFPEKNSVSVSADEDFWNKSGTTYCYILAMCRSFSSDYQVH